MTHVVIRMRVWGGESGIAAKLAPRLGPLGLNSLMVGQQIAKFSEQFKGFRVTVQITVVDRAPTVRILPSASTLIIRALDETPRKRKKAKNVKHNGSLTLDTIIEIARQMRLKSIAKTLMATVKDVLGIAQAMGALCDGQNSMLMQKKIANGEIPIPNE